MCAPHPQNWICHNTPCRQRVPKQLRWQSQLFFSTVGPVNQTTKRPIYQQHPKISATQELSCKPEPCYIPGSRAIPMGGRLHIIMEFQAIKKAHILKVVWPQKDGKLPSSILRPLAFRQPFSQCHARKNAYRRGKKSGPEKACLRPSDYKSGWCLLGVWSVRRWCF